MKKPSFYCNNVQAVSIGGYLLAILWLIPTLLHADGSNGLKDIYISIHFKDATVDRALDEISKLSGLSVTYSQGDLPKALKITYEKERVKVTDVLQYVLRGTGLTFRHHNGIIVVFKAVEIVKRVVANGALEGTLSDATTGENLIGASVRVLGTSLGATADANGFYAIKNVPPATYQLTISFIGYDAAVVRDVIIEAGKTSRIDYKLKPASNELQSIEIIGNGVLSGNVVETNEGALVSSIKDAPVIITGISAQQIARSIDQDAGEVARRLPGVSVLNNFVNIRGMHERYNLTVLNDMIAPSSESDRRAFSYDLLPSNMIDKMTVYRSPAPDLLGDWAGGVIKVDTKNTSIARQIEINLSGWVRGGTTGKDEYTYDGGKRDWLGSDDGGRSLPKGFPSIYQIPGTMAGQVNDDRSRNLDRISQEELAQNAQWGQKLYSRWNLKRDKAPVDYRAGINYYDSWLLGKVRLNNLTSINTTQSTQIVNQEFNPWWSVDAEGKPANARTYNDTISRKNARWGILQNLKLRINPSHTIELKGIFNQLGTDETYVRKGFNDYVTDFDNGYVTKIFYTYRTRSIFTAQLAGQHALGANKDHHLSWRGGYAVSKDDTPAQRLLHLKSQDAYDETQKRYATNGAALGVFSIANSLYYSNSKETNYTGFLDYEKKLTDWISLKAGAFDEKKVRDIDGRLINIGTRDNLNFYLRDSEGQKVDEWNVESALNPSMFREDGQGLFIYDNRYFSGQYKVDGNIVAGYVAANIQVVPSKLSVYGGIRWESQQLEITTPFIGTQRKDSVVIDRTLRHWLPSVNVKYSFAPQLAFRAAYGKTINRPNYREMIPLLVNDPKLEMMQVGNSKLTDATIDNYDARLELYPTESEFISVGVFYKDLHNAIEPYVDRINRDEFLKFSNSPKATVKGIELEVRKSLAFIPGRIAQYFSTIANVALLKSEVKFADSLIGSVTGDFTDFRPNTRQLEGTAKYVINAGLYFEHPTCGTKISVLYNVLGQRLVYAGTGFFPATYELPRHNIDITLRQRITKNLEFRFGVQDILNQPRKLYRDYDRDEKYNPDRWNKLPFKDYTFQKFRPGSYWMMGVNITL